MGQLRQRCMQGTKVLVSDLKIGVLYPGNRDDM